MVVLHTFRFFGSFRELWGIKLKVVVLNNKIYWNAKAFIVQYNTNLEIKFFNSSEMEEKAVTYTQYSCIQLLHH